MPDPSRLALFVGAALLLLVVPGLSALLASSALAFDVVKYLGAAYLIVIGVRRLAGLERRQDTELPRSHDLGRLYRQGIVVNVLNPKTALFFLAFLPQFVDSTRGAAWAQILALGLLFAALGFLSDGVWALVAGTFGERLRRSKRFPQVQRYVSGSVFIGLGAAAALSAPVKTSR
jgi:threonine/homoserine/homoserine lactone efflux protein